ncbi:MAG: TonB-dependent receptor, partial [Chitinophagaceae bacterium]
MHKFFILLLTVGAAFQVHAQKISGVIKDDQGKYLQGASLILKVVKDSSVVKLAASNSTGNYTFSEIKPGKYFINASFIGFSSKNIDLPEINGEQDITAPEITLTKSSGSLKEVVITSRKPVIEVKADKTILNVEGSVNAVGQDALELLRKSPGVMVDKDENISLSGKNGVQVYIDGRPTPLSGADLSAYLKTLQSSSIEAIEIITNPSAKYDAAGNAGIINIRLKKDKSYGTNGSVNAGYGIGIFPKYLGGMSLNNRTKHLNVYANYNYNKSRNESYMFLHRQLLDTLFDQKSTMSFRNDSHNFKAGLDYFINNKSTVGVMVNGNYAENTFANVSRT